MSLPWPVVGYHNGDIDSHARQPLQELLDEFADVVASSLTQAGFPLHASPIWRSWNLYVVRDSQKVLAAFTPSAGGVPNIRWMDQSAMVVSPASLVSLIASQVGLPVAALVTLPLPAALTRSTDIQAAAIQHFAEVEHANRLGRLGDLTGLTHLESHLRRFLDDHPDPDHNIFVMMRFLSTEQMAEIYKTISETCTSYGFHAVRADDRDYTGELWSNIEVYMTCCSYGIAVFEDIERRDFNPNVSLELGYMMGRRKRTLILKEQRLPDLPADVVHRLYKPFDMFSISGSVSREVQRWIEVDLGFPRPAV